MSVITKSRQVVDQLWRVLRANIDWPLAKADEGAHGQKLSGHLRAVVDRVDVHILRKQLPAAFVDDITQKGAKVDADGTLFWYHN